MGHYFENEPVHNNREVTIEANLRGADLKLTSGSGVFSIGKIDRGGEVLTEYAQIEDGQTIVDLGCGFGMVGIALAKAREVDVILADVNKRAIKYTRMNVKQNRVENKCTILLSDGFQKIPEQPIDVVLFNPPQHAGKDLCLRLIDESLARLKTGGSLQLVCRHNVGGASFEKYMKELFGNVETLCRKSGYRVYKSNKEN